MSATVSTGKAMVGQPAPDFDMPSTKNIEKLDQNVKLSHYKGKELVLVFYPLGVLFLTLLLVVFIGEAIREAFDPKEFSRLR